MPAPLQVDKEAVRALVVAVGVREAARQMGIAEGTVQAWSARYKWTEKVKAAQQLAIASKPVQPIATKPADALANVLVERKEKSRTHLSKYVVDAGEQAANSNGDLAIAQDVRHVAAIHSSIWPEEQQAQNNVMVNLAILGMSQE